jgi:predicted AlkP superfamily pyrophosphatase or phosphodiesterase
MGIIIAVLTLLLPSAGWAADQGRAEHVVVVVWDGMRPDFITKEHTPTLYQLAQDGTFFQHHHPVYISTTEVNGTALNTGDHPEHSGLIANNEYRPQIEASKAIAMEDEDAVRRGDLESGGHYIAVPTLAEIIQGAGFATAITGTKSVTLLLDRAEVRASDSARASANFFKGKIRPASAMSAMVAANDGQPFPAKITFPNVAQDAWTTRGLTGGLWKNGVPKFSVLWMSDPDYTQHNNAPGSPEALGALESIDRNLAVVLQTLEAKKLRGKTDVFVVSDHGFSTVERSVDVAGLLKQAGFHAAKKFSDPQPGDILVVGLGGSVSLYVIGHDEAVIRKLVEFFQASDFAGVIFSRLAIEGTFPLEQVRVATTNAPDVLVSMRWNAKTNAFGAPGMFAGDTNKKGAHGSLSPFDMHNTLVAAGPDFRRGFKDPLPTGNIDLAPTILWILGLQPPQKMDGRILSEAMNGLKAPKNKPEQKTLEAANDSGSLHWRQYLKTSSVGDTIYFDEGNTIK